MNWIDRILCFMYLMSVFCLKHSVVLLKYIYIADSPFCCHYLVEVFFKPVFYFFVEDKQTITTLCISLINKNLELSTVNII